MESSSNLVPESLYLIAKYLKSTRFAEIGALLESAVSDEGVLGSSFNWDGTERTSSLTDIEKKYSKLPSDQIVRLLGAFVTNMASKGKASTAPLTLLRPVRDILGESASSTNAAQKYLLDICNLRDIRRSCVNAQNDLKEILAKIKETTFEESTAPTAVELDDFDAFDPLAESVVYKQSPVVQKANHLTSLAALNRNERAIKQRIGELQVDESTACACLEKSMIALTQSDALLPPFSRQVLNSNRLDWLASRSLGATSSYQAIGSTLSYSTSVSSYDVNRSHICRFRFLWQSTGHTEALYSAVFDKSGRFIITGADDYLVKLWDFETGNLVKTYRGHKSEITVVAISPDNSLIASSSLDMTIRVWRLRDGLCLKVLKHNDRVNYIAFDKHSGALVSGTDGGICNVWDLCLELSDYIDSIPLLDVLTARNKNTLIAAPSRSIIALDLDDEEAGPSTTMSNSSSLETEVPAPHTFTFSNTTGIFTWSRERSTCGPLSLSHIVIDGNVSNQIDIDCLDISPAGNYIVTGRTDGVATVWVIGDLPEALRLKPDFVEKRKQYENLLSSMSREDILLNGMESSLDYLYHKVMDLQGHLQAITRVSFCNQGDRLLTGSRLDGSIRVWSFSGYYDKVQHYVINLSEEGDDHNTASRAREVKGRGRQRQVKKKSKSELLAACWTCDDSHIVTLQSVPSQSDPSEKVLGSKLKVWNSMNGMLLRIIEVSQKNKVHILVAHPKIPSIVVTAGSDGQINMWDIDLRLNYFQYDVKIPDTFEDLNGTLHIGDACPLYDANFSPDGTRLAVSDHTGRLLLFGVDNPERFTSVKSEQLFANDFNEVAWGEDGWAIDVNTQLPVHEVPRAVITTLNGQIHEEQPTLFPVPCSLSREVIESNVQEYELSKEKLKVLMDATQNYFRRKSKNPVHIERNAVDSAEKGKVHSVWELQSRKLSSYGGFSPEDSKINRNIVELSPDNPYDSDYSDKSEYDWNDGDDDDSPKAGRRRGTREERETYLHLQPAHLRTAAYPARTTRNSRLAAAYAVDLDGNPLSPIRANPVRKSRKKLKKSYILDDDDSEDEDEDEDEESSIDDSDSSSNSTLHQIDADERLARKLAREEERKSRGSERTKKTKVKKIQNSSSSSRRDTFGNRGGLRTVPENTELDRDIAESDTLSDAQYFPQVGDNVIYCSQGHVELLQDFPDPNSNNGKLPWNCFPRRFPVVECKVVDIHYDMPSRNEYEFSNSIVAKVTLVVVGTPVRWEGSSSGDQLLVDFGVPRSTRNNSFSGINFKFVVKLRLCDSVPDFIIPKHQYLKGTQYPWRPGVRFSVYYKEENGMKEYTGQIEKITDTDPTWPQSPWECIVCRYYGDDGELERDAECSKLSPWELYPFNADRDKIKENTGPKLTPQFVDRAQDVITTAIQNPDYEAFAYQVSGEQFPDYYRIIAAPMYLELISARLTNNYYRQEEALGKDLDMIVENCQNFNEHNSDIVHLARALVSELKSLLWPHQHGNSSSSSSSSVHVVNDENENLEILDEEINGSAQIVSSRPHTFPRPSAVSLAAKRHHDFMQSSSSSSSSQLLPVTSKQQTLGSRRRDEKNSRDSLNYGDDDESDSVKNNDDDDDDENYSEEEVPDRSSLRTSTRQSSRVSSTRRNVAAETTAKRPVRATKVAQSYAEFDDSEFEDVDEPLKKKKKRSTAPTRPTSRSMTTSTQVFTDFQQPRRLDPELKRKMLEIVAKAEEEDHIGFFAEPVTEEDAPGYFDIIVNPMDFKSVRDAIAQRKIQSVDDLAEAIYLIYSNCEKYNEPSSEIGLEAKRQRAKFERLLRTVNTTNTSNTNTTNSVTNL